MTPKAKQLPWAVIVITDPLIKVPAANLAGCFVAISQIGFGWLEINEASTQSSNVLSQQRARLCLRPQDAYCRTGLEIV